MILSASSLRKQGPQRERARVHRYAVKAAIEAGVVSLFIQAMRAGGYGSPEFTNEVQHFRLEVLPWGGVTNSFHWKIDARLPAFGSRRLDPTNRGGNAGVRVTVWPFENPILWGRDERSSLFLIPPHKGGGIRKTESELCSSRP